MMMVSPVIKQLSQDLITIMKQSNNLHSVELPRHLLHILVQLSAVFMRLLLKNIQILFVNCFNLFVKIFLNLRHLNEFEIILLFEFSGLSYVSYKNE